MRAAFVTVVPTLPPPPPATAKTVARASCAPPPTTRVTLASRPAARSRSPPLPLSLPRRAVSAPSPVSRRGRPQRAVNGARRYTMSEAQPVGEGDTAPPVELPATCASGRVSLREDFTAAQPVIVYFFPKADTPGCTTQANALRDAMSELTAINDDAAAVIGISRDTVDELRAFQDKYGLNFTLASDAEPAASGREGAGGKVTEAYGVWKLRNMFGREFMGIERSTFIVQGGTVRKAWRGVRADQHKEWVMNALRELKASTV